MEPNDTGRTLRTTKTSLELIEHIVELDGANLSELAEITELAKSTIYNHLNTLAKCGYIVNENNRYYIGAKFCHLGQYARNQKMIHNFAEDIVSKLAEKTELDADFAVEEHGRIVSLHGEIASASESHFLTNGQPFYVHCTASGKAIIAEYPEERVQSIVDRWGLPRETEQSITTQEELFAELSAVREQGYAVSCEESISGLWAISMAVKDPRGDVYGALSLSGPTYLINEEVKDTMLEILHRNVNEFEDEITQSYDTNRYD